MEFKPLFDRVLVSRKTVDEEKDEKIGLIIIPKTAQERPHIGTIAAIGEAVKAVHVGDLVMFDKYSGSEIELELAEGKKAPFVIVEENDIMGVILND